MMLEVLWLTPEHEDTTGPETVSSELQKDDEFMESSPLTKVELL